jgi:cysteine synthase
VIDLRINESLLEKTVARAKERDIIIPTFAQMQDPGTIPEKIREQLKHTGLWDLNSRNLFRITWKNEQKTSGGLYGGVNYIELPPGLTGVRARIVAMLGKWFPTGCHKVGASFGCLVPRLVTGQFDPSFHKAVWPSTGNYCRGGAYNSALLGCQSVAILPEGMSRERFEWLSKVAGEVIATPGCESNVKEIFDKTWELRTTRDNVVIFNQFEELGNCLWHYHVTGQAIAELFESIKRPGDRFAGACFTSGSAGTMSAGDYLKELYPKSKLAVAEALQCPTLMDNGFGDHRIEGIGDKHVPWIHNVKNTDMVIGIDDADCMGLLRLFNEPAGREYLAGQAGVPAEIVGRLELLGISGIANILSAVKFAKYYELSGQDVVATVLTDSMELYGSRLEELRRAGGPYTPARAAADHERRLLGQRGDCLEELGYRGRKRIHNLKYYTWVEQQGKTVEELNAQWYDYDNYWGGMHKQVGEVDALINAFNERTGLLKKI